MWDLIGDMLRTPDAQDDPADWATTLLAHAMIGVGLAVLIPWWLVVGGYAAWEAVQWRRYGAGVMDCALDWCAVSLGVCVALWVYPTQAVLALVVVMAVGVRARG